MGRVSAAVSVLCTLMLPAACARRVTPPRPIIADAIVVDHTPDGERPASVNLEAVRAEALRLQREGGVFVPAPGRAAEKGDERWRLRVEIGLGEGAREGRGLARAAVALRLEQLDAVTAPRLEVHGGAERPYALETPDVDRVYTDLVIRVLSDLTKDLLTRARLRHADVPALIAALRSERAEERLGAIAAAAERRERAAVPTLIERLDDPVEAVSDRALGALVEIGDQRAVKALTRETRFHDLDRMHKIIDAIASLGGGEARTYLEFVASGHEEADIRDQAKEALDRLRRKEQAAPRK
jgi:hypothetical protein